MIVTRTYAAGYDDIEIRKNRETGERRVFYSGTDCGVSFETDAAAESYILENWPNATDHWFYVSKKRPEDDKWWLLKMRHYPPREEEIQALLAAGYEVRIVTEKPDMTRIGEIRY